MKVYEQYDHVTEQDRQNREDSAAKQKRKVINQVAYEIYHTDIHDELLWEIVSSSSSAVALAKCLLRRESKGDDIGIFIPNGILKDVHGQIRTAFRKLVDDRIKDC